MGTQPSPVAGGELAGVVGGVDAGSAVAPVSDVPSTCAPDCAAERSASTRPGVATVSAPAFATTITLAAKAPVIVAARISLVFFLGIAAFHPWGFLTREYVNHQELYQAAEKDLGITLFCVAGGRGAAIR
ncbi:hypothetical protein AB0M54_21555 [Actinoplanes sp. NPDC051470]|uniref:hypothetical protein n=1 Tax=Actinoplanes sp. NPDC051470 TaxID=3157224 RepID=UPI0034388D87